MPYSGPGACQVVTLAPDGSSPQWLSTLGHVSAVAYSFTCPGGPDQMSCTLARSSRFRSDALNPGRIVQVCRGGAVVWDGKLDEPDGSSGIWSLTAHGAGTFGTDFMAEYGGQWGTGNISPDNIVNRAIARGLRWVNPGIGIPAGIWLAQPFDPASITITDYLNAACQKGGLTWYVSCRPRGNVITVFPLPTAVTRVLAATSPAARTLGGDINRVWERYQVDTDKAGHAAAYDLTLSYDHDSVVRHGPMETYTDLSSAGPVLPAAAQAVGYLALQQYHRANWAGPFTVQPGGLLTTGGTPVDLAMEQAASVCKLVLTDAGYGGELTMAPIQFITGAYAWDDDAQTATITPYQSLRSDFGALLSEIEAARNWNFLH